jgi:outer membrane protein TolC
MRFEAGFILLSLTVAPFAGAQELPSPNASPLSAINTVPLSEKEAVNTLIQNSMRWKQALEVVSEAKAKHEQANAALLPHVALSMREIGGRINLLQYGITELGDINYFAFGASMLEMSYGVFDQLSSRRERAAAENEQSSIFANQSNQTDLIYYLLAQYTLTQKWQRLVRNRTAAIDNIQKLKVLAEEKFNSGIGIDLDVKRVETRLAMAKVKFLDSIGNHEKAKGDLSALMGVEPIQRPLIEIDQLLPIPAAFQKVEPTEALQTRPDFLANHHLIDAARLWLDSVEGQRWPKIEVLGEVGIAGTSIVDGASKGIVGTFGVFLTLPLYTGGYLDAQAAEAHTNFAKASFQEDQIAMDAKNQMQSASRQFDLAKEALEVAQHSEELSSEELELANRRFKLGAAGNLDVISSQVNFAQAQDDLAEAWSNYRQATYQLLKANNKLRTYVDAL